MWMIYEKKAVAKILNRLPSDVVLKYEAWKRIVELEGPEGLRQIKGFHDEALKGEWKGFRSSRLGRRWRIIYFIAKGQLEVYVVEVMPHTYKMKENMTMSKRGFVRAKVNREITPGEMLRTLRELQNLTQQELANRTGLSQSNLSAMENNVSQIGRDRALVLAKALHVHPSVILFPDFDVAHVA